MLTLLSGQYCTENVDECELMPNACQNGGTCHDTHGSYHCVCVNGWTGDDCSENIDDCASAACYHGATCHDRVASFFCECSHGRTGTTLIQTNFIRMMFLMKRLKGPYVMIKSDDESFSLCSQVCCATLMTPASATHVRRVPTVIPTQSMARQSAHVLQVTPGQPVTWTLTSAPSVCRVQKFSDIQFACTNMTGHA